MPAAWVRKQLHLDVRSWQVRSDSPILQRGDKKRAKAKNQNKHLSGVSDHVWSVVAFLANLTRPETEQCSWCACAHFGESARNGSLVGRMTLELVATHIISRLTAERSATPIADSRRPGKTRGLQQRTHRMYRFTIRGGQLARTG